MDFMRALQYPFEDEDWLKKLGILLIAGFIPIVGSPLATLGWTAETARAVKAGNPKPLASWDDIGGIIGKGVPPTLGYLVYMLPAFVLICLAFVIQFAGIGAAAGTNDNNTAGALAGTAGVVMICCYCIVFLYMIAAAIVFMGGFIRFLDKPEFSTFMQFSDNLALVRNNGGDFGMAILYLIGAGLVAGLASSVTFGIGGLVALPFMNYFASHIYGQLAAKLAGAAPRM